LKWPRPCTGFSGKNELLFQRGINFNDLPAWQRRGTAVFWRNVEQEGRNSKTGKTVRSTRRRVFVDEDLPRGKAFDALVAGILQAEMERGSLAKGR
jgi:tRNA(His) guanylyltransferase